MKIYYCFFFPFFSPFYTDLANKLFGVEWKGFWLRGSRVGIYRIWCAFRPLFWSNIQPHSSWNIGGKGLFMKGLLAWKERVWGWGFGESVIKSRWRLGSNKFKAKGPVYAVCLLSRLRCSISVFSEDCFTSVWTNFARFW